MKIKRTIMTLFIAIGLILTAADWAFAANQLLYENFDDQLLDVRFVIYGNNWAVLSPPQYNLTEVGRGGTGYCFSSGTIATAYTCWMQNVPHPWPSDEMYVSFWMRYPTFESTDSHENIKLFYPHWDGTSSYVHYSMAGEDTIYYGAYGQGQMLTNSNWLNCPDQTDGNWHHYVFYVKFSTGISRFWYDGVLKVDDAFGTGLWTNAVYYISAPSIDAEDPGIFSRQVDDWEAWDGMPNTTGNPGDANGDGMVSVKDMIFVATRFGSRQGDASWDPRADLNGNGVIDVADLVTCARHFGE